MFTRLAQEEEPNACHVSNGKHVIVHVIRSVSVMQDGAHNCNGNRLYSFRWSILFGAPLKLLTKLEVDVSMAIHSDVRGPIHLHAWPTSCGASETEPDHMGSWLVERHPSRILLPKTCECGTMSVEVSQGSMECVAQNSYQHPQCLLEAVDCLAMMLD